MRHFKFLILVLGMSFFSSLSFAELRRCGTPELTEVEKILIPMPMKSMIDGAPQFKVIKTYVHVTTANTVAEDRITEQIEVLNEAYLDAGLRFELEEINVVTDPEILELFSGREIVGGDFSPEYQRGKRLLKQGDSSALNIYVSALKSLLGWATFPWAYDEAPLIDGVVINVSSLPQGQAPYGEGQTLTHEVGHWLGLYHTFQGGCNGQGDLVADTVSHSRPTYGCPSVDTVPVCGTNSSDLVAPVSNFMNYTDDACMTEFSREQNERMNAAFSVFRNEFIIDL